MFFSLSGVLWRWWQNTTVFRWGCSSWRFVAWISCMLTAEWWHPHTYLCSRHCICKRCRHPEFEFAAAKYINFTLFLPHYRVSATGVVSRGKASQMSHLFPSIFLNQQTENLCQIPMEVQFRPELCKSADSKISSLRLRSRSKKWNRPG